eukprot:NODE_3971_length_886_cov_43.604540_g3659_i0.p1 GENE.NODE_3971_length_886_cov_43.604540_g3659_i0~~NODE_3971_length_886_cov_43.604540_g3659_i0.p1  ORF type:complete len:216 (-),score=37.57 NODE_3971_length_886_cov_43.604540_g3659_i0:157-804(-)
MPVHSGPGYIVLPPYGEQLRVVIFIQRIRTIREVAPLEGEDIRCCFNLLEGKNIPCNIPLDEIFASIADAAARKSSSSHGSSKGSNALRAGPGYIVLPPNGDQLRVVIFVEHIRTIREVAPMEGEDIRCCFNLLEGKNIPCSSPLDDVLSVLAEAAGTAKAKSSSSSSSSSSSAAPAPALAPVSRAPLAAPDSEEADRGPRKQRAQIAEASGRDK